jgi:uncharacterized protein
MPNSRYNELSNPLDDEEIEKLSDILDSVPNENAMTLEMLDGFFTALHCCPHLVPPSGYLHKIYGDETRSEATPFEDEKQFYLFFELLTRYWNGVKERLRSGKFRPFLEDIPDVGSGWSIGFLQGVLLAEGNFESMVRDENESMALISIFMLALGNEKFDGLPSLFEEEITSEMRKELLEGLPASVMLLYHSFRDSGEVIVPRQARRNEIGRNDRCLCGSGKKYKKCCLNKTVY